LNVLIPMAGLGTRFNGSRFGRPKPLIDIYGKTMIQRAIESLGFDEARHLFVIRQTEDTAEIIENLSSICKDPIIQIIDKVTEGPASTCLLMEEYINNDDELVIANCDQIMFWDTTKFLYGIRYPEHDGLIVTYTANTDKNSYAKINQQGDVLQVKEKCVISDISLNGIHYWRRGSDFVESAKSMIEARDTAPNGEYYVGPTYNYMIKKGKKVGIYHIPNWQHNAVGIPMDLERFLKKYYESL
jgi:dTDP-glucose pyrophosphorylase